jgi:hypothetical protein
MVGPTAKTKELDEREILVLKFWEQLLGRAKDKGVMLHAQRSPSKVFWISAGAGVRAGVSFNYVVYPHESAAELYISTKDKEENKRLFDDLRNRQAEIEQAFGGKLSWERLDEKKPCRVRCELKEGGLKDEGKWPVIQDAMIDAMDRLAKAVKPYIARS